MARIGKNAPQAMPFERKKTAAASKYLYRRTPEQERQLDHDDTVGPSEGGAAEVVALPARAAAGSGTLETLQRLAARAAERSTRAP
jgi:hypothetical protein